LIARKGGVLSRGGHTEAAMDLAKLAGAPGEGGVLCEVVDKNTGDMLRLSNGLIELSKELNLPLTSIDAIQRFRMRRERLISTPQWNHIARTLKTDDDLQSTFGLMFESLFFENQSISVVVSKSRKRTRANSNISREKAVVKVEFPDVEIRCPATSELAKSTLLTAEESDGGIRIDVTYCGMPFFDTKVASVYSSAHLTSQTRRRVVDKSSSVLFPPPLDVLLAFKKCSLYDEYSVCDRVSAEIAQVVRCALQVEMANIEVGDDVGLGAIQIEPMYDEVASKPKSVILSKNVEGGGGGGDGMSVLSYPEDNDLIDKAKALNRWPNVFLDIGLGLPMPRLWEHGLICKVIN